MHTYFEKAQAALNIYDFTSAKEYYYLCTKTPKEEISLDEQKSAIYMLMYLYLQEGDFNQALVYFKLLDNPDFKSKLLPKKFKKTSLEILTNALKTSKTSNITSLNLQSESFTPEHVNLLLDAFWKSLTLLKLILLVFLLIMRPQKK